MIEQSNIVITILIIGRDTSKELKRLLNSIESQKISIANNVDILYIDDGSNDNSVDVFNLHRSRYTKKCIENSVSIGRSASRNCGIKSSRGEYLIFLNSNVEVVGTNLVQSYVQAISDGISTGFGRVRYESKDKPFQGYLITLIEDRIVLVIE